MKIPSELKTLYKHWRYYTESKSDVLEDSELLKEIVSFASERMCVWQKREQGLQPPYTNDPILSKYRFCNIYRELDRQTIGIHIVLKPLTKDLPLWLLNTAFNRFLCNPNTYQKIGSLSFDESNNSKVYRNLVNLPSPKYGTAYIFPISVIQRSNTPTREEFFCFYLPTVIPLVAEKIKSFKSIGVVEALDQILPIFGYNFRFHWTEILIDVAYQYPGLIDLNKKFPIGPGSLPTMKQINSKRDPEEICLSLSRTYIPDFPYLEYEGKPVYLTAENWEGIGCEFRKYQNLKAGKGRHRIYNK